MKKLARIDIQEIPENTSGSMGHLDSENGFFIEWESKSDIKLVLRKDGKDYKQTCEQFIKNSNIE
jgi:hypothetical protein